MYMQIHETHIYTHILTKYMARKTFYDEAISKNI